MTLKKQASFFFVKTLLLYAMFVALWSWSAFGAWYGHQFRSVGSSFYNCLYAISPDWEAELRPARQPNNMVDTELWVLKRGRDVGDQTIGSYPHAYASTAVFLTLIFATPLSWQRKLLAVAFGLLLVHLWIAFDLFLLLLDAYTNPTALRLYTPPDWIKSIISFVTRTVTVDTPTRYVVPTIIWLIVLLPIVDWVAIRQRFLLDNDPASDIDSTTSS